MTVQTCLKSLLGALALFGMSLGPACTGDPVHRPTTASPDGPGGGESGADESASASFGPNVPEPTTTDPTTTEPATSGVGTTESPSTGAPGTTEVEGIVCGDGIAEAWEECDRGSNNANTGDCTLECKHATCGDGLVWAGVEACDFGLGNSDAYGGCQPETCQFGPRCGDGVVDAEHEICDRGPLNGTGVSDDDMAPCSLTCRYQGRLVFVTSELYDGDLGGLSGADLKCATLAAAAGLAHPYLYKAWLADGFSAPQPRFIQKDLVGVPYIRPDGRVVAADFDALVTSGPQTGIALTEQGDMLFDEPVWTNTSAFGGVFSPENHCAHWTSKSDQLGARVGQNALYIEAGPEWQTWQDERRWTSFVNLKCSQEQRLYCFDDGFIDEEED